MKNIGLLFGTFNPIHNGHLGVARYFVEKTDLEEVWFVISPHNPFKNKAEILDNTHRLKMVKLAVQNHPNLKSCDVEFELPTPSYTFNTLCHLRLQYPSEKFVLLLGEDNLSHFKKWKDYSAILKNHPLYVYPRKEADPIPKELQHHPKIHFFKAPEIIFSSTEIRKMILKEQEVKLMLTQDTLNYIQIQKLYR